jgi:signal transduction histidine kinase
MLNDNVIEVFMCMLNREVCLRTFYLFCLKLRQLHWFRRILIVLAYFSLCEVLIVYMDSIGYDRGFSSLLILAGILCALLFDWRRALALEWGLLLIYLAIDMKTEGLQQDQIVAFLEGTFLDFFIIATIGFLRYAWHLSEDAKEQAHSLAEIKDQLILNVHHELRSPLATILGSFQIVKDGGLEKRDFDMFVSHGLYAATELQRITDNILDAMRADSDISMPWIRDFDLGHVARDVMRSIDTEDHELLIDLSDNVLVRGDSQQTGQVTRNLLSNCFKYAPKGSEVSVRVWGNHLYGCISIIDKGPGIAPEDIPLLFQKFSRLERDIAGPVRGIGLGLYICRRFIEQMGGKIWVESVLGKGTIFYVTIPRADPAMTETDKMRRVIIEK